MRVEIREFPFFSFSGATKPRKKLGDKKLVMHCMYKYFRILNQICWINKRLDNYHVALTSFRISLIFSEPRAQSQNDFTMRKFLIFVSKFKLSLNKNFFSKIESFIKYWKINGKFRTKIRYELFNIRFELVFSSKTVFQGTGIRKSFN